MRAEPHVVARERALPRSRVDRHEREHGGETEQDEGRYERQIAPEPPHVAASGRSRVL